MVRLVFDYYLKPKNYAGKKENQKNLQLAEKLAKSASQIKSCREGLYYISETDAEILPFIGSKADAVTKENLLSQTENTPDAPVEERDFAEIFRAADKNSGLVRRRRKERRRRNLPRLKELLEKNLKDLKVFKVGRIQIDIYFVGLDDEGNLIGN